MPKDKAYQNLLNKMLVMENAGNILYRALTSKVRNENLRLIYEKLAYNERETAKSIEKEISAINKNRFILVSGLILNLTKLICAMLTARQLIWILKTVLKRKTYGKWYFIYRERNQDFWQQLLNHEDLQLQLLRPF